MVRMAERHGLVARLRGSGVVRGFVQLGEDPGYERQYEHRAEYRNSRERVGATTKDLGHRLTYAPLVSTDYFVFASERQQPSSALVNIPLSASARFPQSIGCRTWRFVSF
jgi:hypothetical protein